MEFDCLKCKFQTNQNHKIDHSSSNAINYRVFKVSLSCAVFCVISSVFAAFNYSVLQSWLQQNARSWLYDLVSKWSAISRKFLRCFHHQFIELLYLFRTPSRVRLLYVRFSGVKRSIDCILNYQFCVLSNKRKFSYLWKFFSLTDSWFILVFL
ncbi:Hypothetical_protein [Hexamita inflata]|uniref:Hypothetical_protein n=1 Tax=Hexamita inflata TaxID=28002 RepID=A0AA86Q597_9EUKA|nr:Hypothetical protein HINF_LOCUS34000 [Hexamita inflata]